VLPPPRVLAFVCALLVLPPARSQLMSYPRHVQVEPTVGLARVSVGTIADQGWVLLYGVGVSTSLPRPVPSSHRLSLQYTPWQDISRRGSLGTVTGAVRTMFAVLPAHSVFGSVSYGLTYVQTDAPDRPPVGLNVGVGIEHWVSPTLLLRAGPGGFITTADGVFSVSVGASWVPLRW
jgi:hypothetical protein